MLRVISTDAFKVVGVRPVRYIGVAARVAASVAANTAPEAAVVR
jgi:hypothetical protein